MDFFRFLRGFTGMDRRRQAMPPSRLTALPIIRPEMLPAGDGANINGPSLIRAPDWLPDRLANYYLYFAHHTGNYIRLAVADRLEGPWTIHAPGTLHLSQAPFCHGHIASPDVHVDEARRQIRMYFHGLANDRPGQRSYVALSSDGLQFSPSPEALAPSYLRAIPWNGEWIGIVRGGVLCRSADGLSPFTKFVPAFGKNSSVRHAALHVSGSDLVIHFSRIGDAPECILRSRINLSTEPSRWSAAGEEIVVLPETEEEGAALPRRGSSAGAAKERVNELRDPAIFSEAGRRYLLYSVAGESGISIAELARDAGEPAS